MSPRASHVHTYVVDANVIVPFVLPEARSAEIRRVFDAAHDGRARLVAPAFWRVECGNVIWKYARRGFMEAGAARDAFDLLDALPIASIDTEILIDTALDVALACGLTVYDSLYVAAALFTEGTLVTADDDLRERASNTVPELTLWSSATIAEANP